MADNITASLPSNLLTTRQYEEQQDKLLNKEDDLDRNAFLTLFTTQLKNQNPLDPMDNGAFVSQLAQFSSLEAMTGMRTSMDNMAEDSKSERFLLGSSLLGKNIERFSSVVSGGGGQQVTSRANLPLPADSGVFNIFDASTGSLIYSEGFKNLPAGGVELNWNGQLQDGVDAPVGQYKLEFIVNRGDVQSVLPLMNKQKISAVSWDSEKQEMMVEMEDGSLLSMAEVGRIEI